MFSRAQVESIARLASLELADAELDLFARQLDEILAYVDELQAVDTEGIPPTASVLTQYPADRPDAVAASLEPAEALANAPDAVADAGLFRVPRIIG